MVIYINFSSGDELLWFYTWLPFCVVILMHPRLHMTDRHSAWADTAKLYFLNGSAAMFQNYQKQQAWPYKTKAASASSYLQDKTLKKTRESRKKEKACALEKSINRPSLLVFSSVYTSA